MGTILNALAIWVTLNGLVAALLLLKPLPLVYDKYSLRVTNHFAE